MFLTASSWDAFEPLKTVLLELAHERSLEMLLPLIVRRLVEREDVALARLWLLGPGDICPRCPNRIACRDQTQCLHLAASAARPIVGEPVVHQDLNGQFRRIPLGAFKVGQVALRRSTVVVRDPAHDPNIKRPDWIIEQRILGFAGEPLLCRGELLGVLGVFLRVTITEAGLDVLRILANHVGAAIATARAFAQVEQMQEKLQRENQSLRKAVYDGPSHEIVAKSAAMQQVLREIDVVAPTDTSVLIQGESGTGKELIAQAIHRRSGRRLRPFVGLNCAAVPRDLCESEFFGHVRGSFSGATRDRVGRFEAAEGGTLFLDEVGEMPFDLQSKLLRVLQEGTFERVGDTRTRTADVRIIAASNRDLAHEVRSGRFREDLYYRLNVFPIHVRPLRERKEDIAPLTARLVEDIAHRLRRPPVLLSPAQLEMLEQFEWPGNVRELRNVLERAVVSAELGGLHLMLPSADVPVLPTVDVARPARASLTVERPPVALAIVREDEMRQRERDNIAAALELCGGRVYGPDGAAAVLGIKPTTLASRLTKLNLRPGRRPRSGTA
jgi:transcriptional regulator with GAF, ATPase, and Fis domain